MYTFLVSLIIFIAVLLVFVVLLQRSKGGGIAGNFAIGNQLIGVKKTTDLLERVTWGLALSLLLLAATTKIFLPTQGSDEIKSVNEEKARSKKPVQLPTEGKKQEAKPEEKTK
jgi:preprotein translocase subunit SecG